jgi:hypothetical protein
LSPIVPGGRDVTRAAYVDSRLGIPFRSGEPAHLVVCSGGPCGNAHAELLAEKVGDALQLGPIFYLPCTSHPFSSSSCSFAFANDGSLKSIGTVNKTATAEAVTGTLSSNLDTLSGLQTTLSGAKAKQLAAETAELKAEADYAAAKAALADNPNEAILLETTATKARIELLQAQKAEWDARVALAQTQALTGVAP